MHSIRQRQSIPQFYSYFTLGLAVLFIGFYLFEEQIHWWQADSQKALPIILGCYFALAVANVQFTKQNAQYQLDQYLPNQMIEILIMGLLMIYITPGQQDLAVILLFHVGIGNLLVSKRYGYLLAAMATIMVLTQGFLYPSNKLTDRILSGSFISILFFIEATIIQAMHFRLTEAENQAEQTQTQLDSAARLNDLIIERMHTGVCLINNAGQVRRINRAALEHLPEIKVNDFIPNSLFERFQYWQEHNLQNENEVNFSEEPVKNDAFVYFAAIDSNSTLVFIENKDTVVRKAHQFKLNSLARMAASIAHEIRNPLNAISHASQLLAENQALNPSDKRLCDIILNHCTRMEGIIQNVIQISKRSSSQLQWIQLNHWLQTISIEFGKQFDCAIDIKGESLDVRFDPSQLHQVLWNLTQNAKRYGLASHEKGITLNLTTLHNRACLQFIDQGPGLSLEAQEYIYEPFHTTSADGVGLGLYLIKELCEANHAEIRYDGGYLQGAKFNILFAHDYVKDKDTQ